MATVYNHLHQLCEAGQIRRICVDGQPDRYDRMVRHDHLVCRKCGRLTDITLEINGGKITRYSGNYNSYVKEREGRREVERAMKQAVR